MLCHHPAAASVVQLLYKVLSDIVNLAECTPAKVRESSEWTPTMNIAEENISNLCKTVDGKPLLSALYGIYMVTMNELKAVLKVNAQAGQRGAVNRTSQWNRRPRTTTSRK
jgi:hypothetical protein